MLEDANLISTVQTRGGQSFTISIPLRSRRFEKRWINKFEVPRLRALSTVKKIAEEAMTDKPSFVYVTYIASTADNVWKALTDAQATRRVLGTQQRLRLAAGIDPWEHRRIDGSNIADVVGTVVESNPPSRLVTTWADPNGEPVVDISRVSSDIEAFGAIVRLTVKHTDLEDESARMEVAGGWSAVLSNLKSYLETGKHSSGGAVGDAGRLTVMEQDNVLPVLEGIVVLPSELPAQSGLNFA